MVLSRSATIHAHCSLLIFHAHASWYWKRCNAPWGTIYSWAWYKLSFELSNTSVQFVPLLVLFLQHKYYMVCSTYVVKKLLKVDQNVQMCLMAQIKAYTILIKIITSISCFITAITNSDLCYVGRPLFNRGIETSNLWKRARSFKGKLTTLSFFSHMWEKEERVVCLPLTGPHP